MTIGRHTTVVPSEISYTWSSLCMSIAATCISRVYWDNLYHEEDSWVQIYVHTSWSMSDEVTSYWVLCHLPLILFGLQHITLSCTYLHLWGTLQWMLTDHQILCIPGLGSHTHLIQCRCGYWYVHWAEGLDLHHHYFHRWDHMMHRLQSDLEMHMSVAVHCCYAMLLVQPVGHHHNRQSGHFQWPVENFSLVAC